VDALLSTTDQVTTTITASTATRMVTGREVRRW
jgi:hypothetical protein